MRVAWTMACLLAAAAVAEPPTLEETRAAIERGLAGMTALQRSGGWGRAETVDLQHRRGEHGFIDSDWITLQPPATPTVAGVYLRATKALGAGPWESALIRAQRAIVGLQTPHGGFPHEGDPTDEPRPSGTLDDDTTTASINFLLDWAQHTEKPSAIEPVVRGAGFLIEAQYDDCGGWPQYYPPPRLGYRKYITLNDNVMYNAIETLLRLHREPGLSGCLAAAKRAGDCLIRLQGGPGERIWAQQYDPETLEPASARRFEHAGYTPAESALVMQSLVLLYLYTGEEKYLDPLDDAFAWYETHELPDGSYARLYEPGTETPVYGHPETDEKVYDVAQARGGYGWQGNWYPTGAKQLLDRIEAEGREAVYADILNPEPARHPSSSYARGARAAIDGINDDGVWVSKPTEEERGMLARRGVDTIPDMIRSGDFVTQMTRLLNYYEALVREQEEDS